LAMVVGLAGMVAQSPSAQAAVRPVAGGSRSAAPPHAGGFQPLVRAAVRHDTSAPLRTIKPLRIQVRGSSKAAPRVPRGTIPKPSVRTAVPGAAVRPPVAVQRSELADSMPPFGENFSGLDAGSNPGYYRQDDRPFLSGAVGPNDYVQMSAFSFA